MSEATVRKRTKTLGIDIDNVISQTDVAIRQIIHDLFGIDLGQEQILHFDYHKCGITKEQEEQVFKVFNESRCNELAVVPGAVEALAVLRKKYFVVLVTSRNLSTERATKNWLKANDILHDLLIFESVKNDLQLDFDYFIEDCWEYAARLGEAGVRVILLDYPWNRSQGDHPNITRVGKWDDIVHMLI